MGAAHGRVVRTTKIVNAGPSAKRWDLVIISEGYQSGELAQFATDADALKNGLLATPPFSSMTAAINVFRIDVESTDSGADEPAACGGSGATRNTFLDATFCGNGNLWRYLTVDKSRTILLANSETPNWNAIVMIVNTTDYGGAALGQVAVCSKHPQTIDIALHELGHVFGLADEYEEGLGKYQPPEPASVNVTKKTAGLKWGAMVLPTTAVPTRVNVACRRQGPTGPVPKGIIGALEGAKGHECNIYRPSAACKMRDVGDDFCAVCQDHISAKLAPYLTNT